VFDMFFRSAAFAYPEALWSSRVASDWLYTFQPFLVNLENFRLYLAGFVIIGAAVLFIAWKARSREECFGVAIASDNSVVPESASTASQRTGSTTLVTTSSPGPTPVAVAIGVYLARLLEGATACCLCCSQQSAALREFCVCVGRPVVPPQLVPAV
jgi:hypothetical protein